MKRASSRFTSFRPAVEGLEERSLMACNVFLSAGVLNVNGDAAPDRVILNDDGGGHVSGVASGKGAFAYDGVKDIVVDTGGGNDSVQYNLVSDLKAHVTRTVSVALGDGNDTFSASLHNPATGQASNLEYGSLLMMGVYGQAGNDRMLFNAQGVAEHNATMKIGFQGGDGNDLIEMLYSGLNDHGGVSFFGYGDAGNDTIAMLFQVDPASVAPAPGGIRGIIQGGDGDDTLLLKETAPAAVSQDQMSIDGGAGGDHTFTNIPTQDINNVEGVVFI